MVHQESAFPMQNLKARKSSWVGDPRQIEADRDRRIIETRAWMNVERRPGAARGVARHRDQSQVDSICYRYSRLILLSTLIGPRATTASRRNAGECQARVIDINTGR